MKNIKQIVVMFLVLALLLLTVKAALGAIVIDPIPDQEAIEGVEFPYLVSAEYDNGTSGDFAISAADSILDWLAIDFLNDMNLKSTPLKTNIGTSEISVVITDGAENSAPEAFNLTVKPALEILNVKVNGDSWNGTEEYTVIPGQKFTISTKFINNFDDELGHVEVQAKANTIPDFVNYQGVCNGADCEDGYWVLETEDESEDTFTFQVPYTITAGTFDLKVKVEYDDFWGFLGLGNDFEDEKVITFNLDKKDADVHLDDATLTDYELTCTRVNTLLLSIINTGDQPITPELLVYEKEPKLSSFDKMTGKFSQFNGGNPKIHQFETLPAIDGGKSLDTSLSLNLSALDYGEHTLYLYLINPYFESSEGKFMADSATLEITVGPCLKAEVVEEALLTIKNSAETKEVDFFEQDEEGEYVYITEDKNYQGILTFEVPIDDEHQSNLDLIECSMDGAKTQLSCDPPAKDKAGVSELTVDIIEDIGGFQTNTIQESVLAEVENTLSISNVKVNGNVVQEGKESIALAPDQEIEVRLTVTNHLEHPVTGVVANLLTTIVNLESDEPINLNAKQSKEIIFKEQLPYQLTKGKYGAELSVSGDDYEDNQKVQSDVFEFIFNLEQKAADLVITDLMVEEEELAGENWNGFTCAPEATVTMNLINKGSNTEDDIVLTVKGGKVDLTQELTGLSIAPNSQTTYTVKVPTAKLSSGSNNLKFEISYRNGYESDDESVSILKNSCLKDTEVFDLGEWILDNNAGSTWILADGEEFQARANLNQEGYENIINWYVAKDGEEKALMAAGQDTYTFSNEEQGEYLLTVEANGEEFVWTLLVTDIPLSTTLKTNIPEEATEAELKYFEDFTIENQYGKIVFNEPVDLTAIFDLDEVITIADGMVAIDTNNPKTAGINVPATITLKKLYTLHKILYSPDFEGVDFIACPEAVCKAVSNTDKGFVFTVTGFSTYKVIENVLTDLEISEISITGVDRGDKVSADVTIKNAGSLDDITEIILATSGIASDYAATVLPSAYSKLAPGESFKAKLEFTVPKDEDGGKHSIGKISVSGKKGLETITKTANVYLDPKSYLVIDGLKVNDKATGKLTVDESNTLKVKIKNDYTEDIEGILVTFTLIDVDGDDLEEEAEEFDLDKGKDDYAEVTFDLSEENLDEDSYTLEITAEGTGADDDSEQKTTFTQTVEVERKDHKLIIKEADLSASIVQCPSRHSSLELTIENVGKKDEKNVEVKVVNTALGLDLTKTITKLGKYTEDDTEDTLKFVLDEFLADAAEQQYPITIEVNYDSDDESETKEVTLEVKDCASAGSAQQKQVLSAEETAKQLSAQLQQQLAAQKAQVAKEEPVTVQTSFRESNIYIMLLAVLVFLVFLAIVLGMAVLVKKK